MEMVIELEPLEVPLKGSLEQVDIAKELKCHIHIHSKIRRGNTEVSLRTCFWLRFWFGVSVSVSRKRK